MTSERINYNQEGTPIISQRQSNSPKMDINALLQKLHIDPMEEIEQPPIVCWYKHNGNESPLFSLGNFSLIIGKAKSRKTFFLTAIMAALLKGKSNIIGLEGNLKMEDKVIFFDNEQAPFHVHRTVKRICRQTEIENPANFKAYGLRPLSPQERVELIDHVITSTDGLKVVVIDGLRDLLNRGTNDEAEATTIITKILKWTYDYNIHIILVLHQNKNDANARGHIGTEAVNKAETVLSIQKHSKDKSISIVTPEYCRDIEFEPFSFRINDQGLPESTELPIREKPSGKVNHKMFEHLLSEFVEKPYSMLTAELIQSENISESTAKRRISEALEAGILQRSETGYSLKPIINNEEDTPF